MVKSLLTCHCCIFRGSWDSHRLLEIMDCFNRSVFLTKEMSKCAPAGICFGASIGFSLMTSIINASLRTSLKHVYRKRSRKRRSVHSNSCIWRYIPCSGRNKYWDERHQGRFARRSFSKHRSSVFCL